MKWIFSRGAQQGSWLGQFFYPLADVAVLKSENTSDKKSIVHTLSQKEGFLWGIYNKKGLGLFGHNRKKMHTVNNTLRALIDRASHGLYNYSIHFYKLPHFSLFKYTIKRNKL